MKLDIKLSGVGGQGILSIATVIGQAALIDGINLKQAEVHGMSQRGGDVQSDLRLSTEPIYSDLIAKGSVDLLISMEPMEALRYRNWLTPDGVIVTSSKPFVNIPNYPDEAAVLAELATIPRAISLDIEQMAHDAGVPRSANMILLGVAAPHIPILSADSLRDAIASIFARKGEAIIEANLRAFNLGLQYSTSL
ncbi:MAG: indolepyruvate oxidoreductase subunit beta [Bacteroidales bacterium]|nr:indolepyruvate oxidoreductase subunit beta [Bacteroidales bacterium]MBO7487806.1 indolepyruvate oxidoreductase subunit beta [Bacteroidales bacterium]